MGPRFRMWIDRTGGYLVCLGEELTLGGPADPVRLATDAAAGSVVDGEPAADVAVWGPLPRIAAVLRRAGEGILLTAGATGRNGERLPLTCDGRGFTPPVSLGELATIGMGPGDAVRFQWRLPTALSRSVVGECLSGHRLQCQADGVVWLQESCWVGNSPQCHIRVPGLAERGLLYRQGERVLGRWEGSWEIDGRMVSGTAELPAACVVTWEELRFRWEPYDG